MFKNNRIDLLIAVYIFCIVASELMGGKTFFIAQIGDFKLNSSVAIFLLPVIFTINDIVFEVFGKQRVKNLITSSIIVIAMIALFSLLATSLNPSARFSATENAYDSIFHISIRFALASLTAFIIAGVMDVLVFQKIKEKMKNKALWLRNNVSNFAAQLADTFVFITLAFYSFSKPVGDNFDFIIGLVLPYWLLKCLMSILETPFVYLGVKWLKGGEKNASSAN